MQRYKRWLPSILVMTIIFMASATPGSVIKSSGFDGEGYHISGHFFLFFLLYLANYRATLEFKYSFILVVVWAILDEIHQLFVPLRSASIFDIFVDVLAALFAMLIIWIYRLRVLKTQKN